MAHDVMALTTPSGATSSVIKRQTFDLDHGDVFEINGFTIKFEVVKDKESGIEKAEEKSEFYWDDDHDLPPELKKRRGRPKSKEVKGVKPHVLEKPRLVSFQASKAVREMRLHRNPLSVPKPQQQQEPEPQQEQRAQPKAETMITQESKAEERQVQPLEPQPDEWDDEPELQVLTKKKRGKAAALSMTEQREKQLQKLQALQGKLPQLQPTALAPAPASKPAAKFGRNTATTARSTSPVMLKTPKDSYNAMRDEVLNNTQAEEVDTDQDDFLSQLEIAPIPTPTRAGHTTCLGTRRYGQPCNITDVEANGYCPFHQQQAQKLTQIPTARTMKETPLTDFTHALDTESDITSEEQVEYEESGVRVTRMDDKEFREQDIQALKVTPPRQVPQYLFVLPNIYTPLEDRYKHAE